MSFPVLGLFGDSTASVASIFLQGWVPPFTWRTLVAGALRVALTLGIAFVILQIVRRGVQQWISRVEDLSPSDPKRQRAFTLGNLLQSIAGYTVWAIAGIMILSEVGLDIGALLATAGVAGLAIGFGAQTLVKDVIGGIFLLFDDVIRVGDLVTISGHTGTIESIGVRLIQLRKFDGELVMIPAGEVRTFGNKSIDWARVVVPVGLSYEQDIDAILPIMEQVAQDWVDEHPDIVLEETPQVQGLMDFGDSSVTARVAVKVKPGEQYAGERDLRQRLKRTFDEQGVEIPFPQRTVHAISEDDGPPRTPAPHSDTTNAPDDALNDGTD